jgi:PHD/YefM family antitoxin component YafN of YafNO toxin-antitoxin module
MPGKESVIQASELYRAGGKVLRRVAVDKERLIIERDGYPVAIILPYEEAEQTNAEKLLDEITAKLEPQAAELGQTEEQAIEDLRKIRKTTHRKQYGKTTAT